MLAGRYQLLELLGEGGMGTVWRAHCLPLDVDVAVKVLHPELADTLAATRLLREAHVLASLGHPAIVRPLDLGDRETGEPFLVMELLEGTTLAAWIEERRRLPPALAVQMILPVASALAAAHAHGIIHRDIKPENILVVPGPNGTFLPKVVDFGIAKVVDPRDGRLTEEGTVMGSLMYMSPEQADGAEVTAHTDVWGLCVVLYELLTGHSPFEASSLSEMVLALCMRDPVPTTQHAAGDARLWAILERGLRKAPEDRWPSVHELGCALASWAVERGIDADIAGTSLSRVWNATAPQAFAEVLADSGPPMSSVVFPSPQTLDTPPARAPQITLSSAPTDEVPRASRVEPRRRMRALGALAALAPMAMAAWIGMQHESASLPGLGVAEPPRALLAAGETRRADAPPCAGPRELCSSGEKAPAPSRAGDRPAAPPAAGSLPAAPTEQTATSAPGTASYTSKPLGVTAARSPGPAASGARAPSLWTRHHRGMPLPAVPGY